MSIASELKKHAGHRVQIQAMPSGRSNSGGETINMILTPPSSRRLGDMFEIARLLVRAGVSVRSAKKAIDDLSAGKTIHVETPAVADYDRMQRMMASQNVAVHRIMSRAIDMKALRTRLGISQEDFAGRYGLDVATVRNWEQGRTKPEGPAATLLQLIDRDPDKIVELLAS
ncbi:MAG: helix-turn-helix domain-containing protein [Alphaproteobacteria bacterium]